MLIRANEGNYLHASSSEGLAMGGSTQSTRVAAPLCLWAHSAFIAALLHIERRNWFWIHDKSHWRFGAVCRERARRGIR